MNLFSILIADNPEGDLSTETLPPGISRNIESWKLSVFRDCAVIAQWIVSNTIIAAPPRFPAIEAVIKIHAGQPLTCAAALY
jgi:hypothetical protein